MPPKGAKTKKRRTAVKKAARAITESRKKTSAAQEDGEGAPPVALAMGDTQRASIIAYAATITKPEETPSSGS